LVPPGLVGRLDERVALGDCQWCRERMVGKSLDYAEVHFVVVGDGAAGTSVFALDGAHVCVV
jgi:hypothetical protein